MLTHNVLVQAWSASNMGVAGHVQHQEPGNLQGALGRRLIVEIDEGELCECLAQAGLAKLLATRHSIRPGPQISL